MPGSKPAGRSCRERVPAWTRPRRASWRPAHRPRWIRGNAVWRYSCATPAASVSRAEPLSPQTPRQVGAAVELLLQMPRPQVLANILKFLYVCGQGALDVLG